MEPGESLIVTPGAILGLFYLQRYRFLTITQVARVAGLSYHHTADLLREFAARGHVGYFGHVRIPGHGKTPKAYYLKRKGWELLRRASDIPEELIGPFSEAHREETWSPQMYHRLRLLDLLIALEVQVRERPQLNLVKTLLEYRRVKRQGRIARETTDFVAAEEIPENRIIPDAAFVLENVETERRACFSLRWTWPPSASSPRSATTGALPCISSSSSMTGIYKAAGLHRLMQRMEHFAILQCFL